MISSLSPSSSALTSHLGCILLICRDVGLSCVGRGDGGLSCVGRGDGGLSCVGCGGGGLSCVSSGDGGLVGVFDM